MIPDPWMAVGISGAAAFFTGIAAIFTGLSAWQTGRTAKAAVDQVELQRQIQIDAAQPYVWADIGEHPTKQGVIALRIKCEGPTAARNVRLTCDRSLPSDEQLATWRKWPNAPWKKESAISRPAGISSGPLEWATASSARGPTCATAAA